MIETLALTTWALALAGLVLVASRHLLRRRSARLRAEHDAVAADWDRWFDWHSTRLTVPTESTGHHHAA